MCVYVYIHTHSDIISPLMPNIYIYILLLLGFWGIIKDRTRHRCRNNIRIGLRGIGFKTGK